MTVLTRITAFTSCDVLCGRGGSINKHPGNVRYHSLVEKHQKEYVMSKKGAKKQIGYSIVSAIRSENGRFLEKKQGSDDDEPDGETEYWVDIGDETAVSKTCQALRDASSKARGEKKEKGKKPQKENVENAAPKTVKRKRVDSSPKTTLSQEVDEKASSKRPCQNNGRRTSVGTICGDDDDICAIFFGLIPDFAPSLEQGEISLMHYEAEPELVDIPKDLPDIVVETTMLPQESAKEILGSMCGSVDKQCNLLAF